MRLLIVLFFSLLSANAQSEQIDLFIMAGQSNMQGWRSDAADYPADPQQLDPRIPFYFEAIDYSSSGQQWITLSPQAGHFRAGHFGPEVSFARALYNTGLNPAILKYSSGGSSIKLDWKAPGQHGLYDEMVKNIHHAISILENQGHTVIPRAIIWIQGETDANTEQLANEYYWHLKKMIQHLRNQVLYLPQLPVILSVDEQHPRVQQNFQVVEAQLNLAMEDEYMSFVSMFGLEKSDATHLTAKGTIQQGKRIFDSYKQLK